MKHRPVALLDACVLVPMPLADTLLRLAEPPAIFDARWSEDILGEMNRTLAQILPTFGCLWLPAPHQPNEQSSERPPCPGRSARLQRRLLGHIQSSGFPATAGDLTTVVGPSAFLKTLWKLDRSAIEGRLREQADAIGFGVEELLDRLAQSVPAFRRTLAKPRLTHPRTPGQISRGCSGSPPVIR